MQMRLAVNEHDSRFSRVFFFVPSVDTDLRWQMSTRNSCHVFSQLSIFHCLANLFISWPCEWFHWPCIQQSVL